jgi:hypothetical protein
MKVASFINGFLAGLVTLVISGAVLAGELLVNQAESWISDFVVIEPESLTPWWFLLAAGVSMVIAASMTFERPPFAMAGFAIAAIAAIVASFAGATHAYIAAIAAVLALVLLLIPPRTSPSPVF